MSELKVGIVVTLQSGGPDMTIAEPDDGQGFFKCTWFDGGGGVQEKKFRKEILKLKKK